MSRRGRRAASSSIVTILWRDIPAQVNAGGGDERSQRILPRRFQKAIDRAAMVAGKTQASDYVAEWRRVSVPLAGEPEAAAVAEAERLEAEFPRERLDRFVAAGGWDPDQPTGPVSQQDTQSPDERPPREPEESSQ